MKRTIVVVALLASFCGLANAIEGLSANVSLTTKYKYRGQDQSDAAKSVVPAIQGGFDYTFGGFYLGNWNSSIGFADGIEMDFYGGYRGEARGIGYDVGVLQYYYRGFGTGDTTELYAAGTWGPVTAKYSHTVSERYFGLPEGRNTGYADLSLKYPLIDRMTLDAHVGFTRLTSDTKNLTGLENYADYKVGVSYDLGSGFALGAAAVGANKRSVWGDVNKTRGIVTLTKSM